MLLSSGMFYTTHTSMASLPKAYFPLKQITFVANDSLRITQVQRWSPWSTLLTFYKRRTYCCII